MRRSAAIRATYCLLLFLFALPITAAAQPFELVTNNDRIERLAAWLSAVDRHVPGTRDDALREAGTWTLPQLQGLWIDFNNLARLMRNPRLDAFVVTSSNGRMTNILYSAPQFRRMVALSCAAGGRLEPTSSSTVAGSADNVCVALRRSNPTLLSPDLLALSERFGAARRSRGDDNLVLWRAAALHSDLAMLRAPGENVARGGSLPVGPRGDRLEIVDGKALGLDLSSVQWQLARDLIEHVQPADRNAPAPAHDVNVRDWYRLTTLWMQAHEDYDLAHLERALRLFPDDSIVLFLRGCHHEAMATPAIQLAANDLDADVRGRFVGSRADEWREAEHFFARAVAIDGNFAEARLRLGRVTAMQGRYEDAVALLRTALPRLAVDARLAYYGQLFVGDAEEHVGHAAAAREAYHHAQTVFPMAQKPRLALSQLAWRQDARREAWPPLQALLESPPVSAADDPWVAYQTSHARDVDARIAAMWSAAMRVPQ